MTAFAASLLDTSIVIFTLEGSGLRRPADLVGKRLGYRKGSEGEAVFDAMMACCSAFHVVRLPRCPTATI